MPKPIIKKISAGLYHKFHKLFPIICVDLIVKNGGKFLLVKRRSQPEKGKWWFPGGRVYKNETLEAAAKRKLKQETGLSAKGLKQVGIYEYFSSKGYFSDTNAHMVAVVYAVDVFPGRAVRLDNQSDNYCWFEKMDKNFHPY